MDSSLEDLESHLVPGKGLEFPLVPEKTGKNLEFNLVPGKPEKKGWKFIWCLENLEHPLNLAVCLEKLCSEGDC